MCIVRIDVNCWFLLVAFYDVRAECCPSDIVGNRYEQAEALVVLHVG